VCDRLRITKNFRSVPSLSCSQAVSKPVWYISLLCVQWKTDDGQRNCPKHVQFYSKNKFEKVLNLVGFSIRNYNYLLRNDPEELSSRIVTWHTKKNCNHFNHEIRCLLYANLCENKYCKCILIIQFTVLICTYVGT